MSKTITKKFPGIKVLVADDYSINLELMQAMLEMMECIVDVAEDGRRAVELCEKSLYNLIFMDLQMPEMDGYDATRAIRKLDGTHKKYTPIIAITANTLTEDRDKCLAAGLDDYISKPIRGEQLEAMLTKHLLV